MPSRGRAAVPAAGVRRQPGRAVLLRSGAGGDRAAAGGAAQAAQRDAAGARRGRGRRQGRLRQAGHRGRGVAVLHRHGGAHGGRASGDLALGRLDRLGDRGDRPAGAAGALSVCARPRPGGQCGGACGGRRRRGAPAIDAVARAAGRADRRADGRSGAACRDGGRRKIRGTTRRHAVARRPHGGYCVGKDGFEFTKVARQ